MAQVATISGMQPIEEKNPLKQGLKPKVKGLPKHLVQDRREESIKTRIETPADGTMLPVGKYRREESIKTRIETVMGCYGNRE